MLQSGTVGDDAAIKQTESVAVQVACFGIAGHNFCLHTGSYAAVLPDASYLLTFLAFGYSKLRLKKQEKQNIIAICFGSTKGDMKAQVHSSGHARFKNKTQLKINSNIPFLKGCMLNNRLKEI